MSRFKPDEQFIRLCDAVFDEQASQADIQLLEKTVLGSPDHKKYYVRRAYEHASLTILANDLNNAEHDELIPEPVVEKSEPAKTYKSHWFYALATMSLGLLLGFGIWFYTIQNSTFAKIYHLKNVVVDNSDFPINLNSRLGKGYIHVKSGIMTIAFDSNATLVIEGPAELELVDSLTCNLYSGRVVSSMPKGESGFVVMTPYASFHDLGTRFGVSVSKHGVADMQVIEGEVDAKHLASGAEIRLKEGDTVRSTLNKINGRVRDELALESPLSTTKLNNSKKLHRISTNLGEGTDKTIIRNPKVQAEQTMNVSNSGEFLMVKNCLKEKSGLDRKVYLKFDLDSLNGRKAHIAGLNMYLANLDLGYASNCQDSTFSIYGIKEEFEQWPGEMNWENAPANLEEADQVDLSKADFLGSFQVSQGSESGILTVKTPELTSFLNSNTNRFATLILVRNTREHLPNGTVHCFAGSQSQQGIPPTLVIEMDEK